MKKYSIQALCLIGLIVDASAAPSIENTWKTIVDKAVLRESHKVTHDRKNPNHISASDLDEYFNYSYPCPSDFKDPHDIDSKKGQSRDPKYASFPQLAFTDQNGNQVYICTDNDNFQKVSADHYLAKSNFDIVLATRGAKRQVIASESEVMARPFDIKKQGSAILLIKNLDIESKGSEKLVPFSAREIRCNGNQCNVSLEKCILASPVKNGKSTVQKFDEAVKDYKKNPVSDLDQSAPFRLLDDLFIAAAKGDAEAKKRFNHFPLEVDGASAEILGTYQLYLDEAAKLGCSNP